MIALLSAGLYRLRRSKFLWIVLGALAVITAGRLAMGWSTAQRQWPMADKELRASLEAKYMDSCFFEVAAVTVMLSSAVCAWELGAEYQDGALRNKLSVGHRRANVYLSSLAFTVLTVLLLCLAVYIPGVIALLLITGGFAMGWGEALLRMAGMAAASAAFASLFTLLCLNIPNRAASAIAAIALTVASLLGGYMLIDRLHEPSEYSGYEMTVNGEFIPGSYPNPRYIPEGPVRDTLEFLVDYFPGGQAMEYIHGDEGEADPLRYMAWDAVLLVLATGGGILIFRRKDLR